MTRDEALENWAGDNEERFQYAGHAFEAGWDKRGEVAKQRLDKLFAAADAALEFTQDARGRQQIEELKIAIFKVLEI